MKVLRTIDMLRRVLLICTLAHAISASRPSVRHYYPGEDMLKVLLPETQDDGANNIVSSTTDLLPEITRIFEHIEGDQNSVGPHHLIRTSNLVPGSEPVPRKLVKLHAHKHSREGDRAQMLGQSAAQAILPSAWSFIHSLSNLKDFEIMLRHG
ncbi:hypothetical protein SK128_013397 [Halocaridina rubra]|uniref:Uncharacterized protein n=1 Tax=Halocaridina rubra TaxID=373956 RepID=A0AAN8ZYA8_HALRR